MQVIVNSEHFVENQCKSPLNFSRYENDANAIVLLLSVNISHFPFVRQYRNMQSSSTLTMLTMPMPLMTLKCALDRARPDVLARNARHADPPASTYSARC